MYHRVFRTFSFFYIVSLSLPESDYVTVLGITTLISQLHGELSKLHREAPKWRRLLESLTGWQKKGLLYDNADLEQMSARKIR